MAGSDAREYMGVMYDGTPSQVTGSASSELLELFRCRDQADYLLHPGPVEILARVHARGDFEFSECFFILVTSHEAGGE
jgi:hypothetical protein